jgi:predicted dehydrogenase
MKKLNFSILCAGSIAKTMAETVSQMSEVTPYAIAARDLGRARNLVDQYGFRKAYGSYEELVNDDNVDLIYIASPHSHHYEHAKLCLEHGKNVLCEKSFTVNQKQAKELFLLAKSKKLFIMEAVWTRFLPFAAKLRELIDSGVIGRPLTLTASFGQNLTHIDRLVNPELAGGALLDLGIYPLTFASMVFGTEIEKIESACVKSDRGVDAQDSVTLVYKNGQMAVLNFSFLSKMKNQAIIYGDKGYIVLDTFWQAESIQVYVNDETEPRVFEVPFDFTGYEYEVRAAAKAIELGELSCVQMQPEETLRILKIMDQLRSDWAIRYPFE